MRELIYLDELLLKIKENKEIGKIMGDAMTEIAMKCKRETVNDTIQKQKKEIGSLSAETTVNIGDIEWEILDTDFQGGVLCMAKEILFEHQFNADSNDWRTSSLRQYLNTDFRKKLEDKIGENMLIEFERDLTSDDGLKDYGDCNDLVSLISCDEYRKYRQFISEKNRTWWTLTPYSTPHSGYSYYVRYVNTDGSLGDNYAYLGNGGVSPACVFLPSLCPAYDSQQMSLF